MRSPFRALFAYALTLFAGSAIAVACARPSRDSDPTAPSVVASASGSASSALDCPPFAATAGSCKVRVLATLRRRDVYDFASDGTHVYYRAMNANSVARVAVTGGEREILFKGPEEKSLVPRPRFALTDKEVVWTREGSVFRLPKKGGEPTAVELVDRIPHGLAFAPSGALLTISVDDPSKASYKGAYHLSELTNVVRDLGGPLTLEPPLFVDGTATVFISSDQKLVQVLHGETRRRVLADRLAKDAFVIGSNAEDIFVREGATVWRIARGDKRRKDAVEPPPVEAISKGDRCLHALDANDLWILGPRALVRVPLSGSAPVVRDSWKPEHEAADSNLFVDAAAVYFTWRTAAGTKDERRMLLRLAK